MATSLRIATFNLENLDDKPGMKPSLEERIAVMRPQLMRLRADILCLQEVNGQETPGEPRRLLALDRLLQGSPYYEFYRAHTLTSDNQPYDVRNLVVLSRYPVLGRLQIRNSVTPKPMYRPVTAMPGAAEAKEIGWERPLLKVVIDLGNNRKLHLMNLHLKSKLPSDIPGQKMDQYSWRSVAGWAEGYFISSMKRVGQALEARIVIDSIFDEAEQSDVQPLIAVCGDFNADLGDVPLHALRGEVEDTGNPGLLSRIMVPCELTVPEQARYSLLHLGKGNMLDHILASRSLMQFYRATEIHNEMLPDESGAFRTDVQFPESDHAPVVAEFQFP